LNLLFCPIFLGATQKRGASAAKKAAALQELARSSAQENERQKKCMYRESVNRRKERTCPRTERNQPTQELTGRELWRTFNVVVNSSRPILGRLIRKIQEKNLVQKEEP